MRSAVAVLASIAGVLLVLFALLVPAAAIVAGQIAKPPVLAAAGAFLAFGAFAGVRLLQFAGRSLRYSRVLQIGAGTCLAIGVAILGWLQQAGAFDRSKVTLENGVLLIQGPLDMDLLASFRQVLQSSDLRDIRVRLRSPGGSIYVGMVIGREIHRRHLDVEVDQRCISSCANYLFTAGRNRYVKSVGHVRFHGGALQPNYVANALMLIEQGVQGVSGADMPPDLDPKQLRETLGLAEDFPFNSAAAILAEKAYFDEIGASALTPVYGQYGDYSAWFNDGVHDSFSYLPEDYALLGVTNVIITEPRADAGFGRTLFRARTSAPGVEALEMQMAALYGKIEAAMPFKAADIWKSK